MTIRSRHLARTLLLCGGALLLGTLATGVAKVSREPDGAPALAGPSAVFARDVRIDHRDGDGLRVRASAESLAWKAPRLLGPFRLGFLREVEARGVRLRIELPAGVAGRSADAVIATALGRMTSGQDERIAGVTALDLWIEIRRPDRSEPLRLRAGYGRWRAGEERPELGEVARVRAGSSERLTAKAGRRLLERWIEKGTTVS